MRARRTSAVAVAVAVALGAESALVASAPAAVAAPPPAAPPDPGRAAFARGVALYDEKKYDDALAAFEAAYADKQAPAILQNVALCLRALGRYGAAIDRLEQMLRDGDTLKPEVRERARKAIGEMREKRASVAIRVGVAGPRADIVPTLTIDGEPVHGFGPHEIDPGEHVFAAAAPGFRRDERRVTIPEGARDQWVDHVLVPADGGRAWLVIRTNVPSAAITVDGKIVGRGVWGEWIPAGQHKLRVVAEGWRTWQADILLGAGETRDVVVPYTPNDRLVARLGPAYVPPPTPAPAARSTPTSTPTSPPGTPPTPAPYAVDGDAPAAGAAGATPERNWYGAVGVAYQAATAHFAPALGECDASCAGGSSTGTTRGLGGASFVLHAGRKIAPTLGVGLLFEAGVLGASQYESPRATGVQNDASFTNIVVAPELRLQSTGRLRIVGGVALGVEAEYVTAHVVLNDAPNLTTVTGSGADVAALGEIGLQFSLGRAIAEVTGFADVHGVASLKDAANDRLLFASPQVRGGLRLTIGAEL